MQNKRDKQHGFTLLEIIVVLLLISIVTATVMFSSSAVENTDVYTAADRLKVHLRYSQIRSMNSDLIWGIVFNGTTYTLMRDISGSPVPELLPGENNSTVNLPGNVTGTVSFDSWGSPSGLSTISLGLTAITITPDTGFIE